MTEALATITPTSVEAYEKALILGDLAGLKPEERISYYRAVCKSVGLNPLTKPFEYTLLNSKLLLYAKRDATDQLRKIHCVSVTSLTVKIEDGIAIATCHVTDREGRTDIATGVLSIKGLSGLDLANAMMKVETKAKRRATLSICGLGLLDETELETIHQDEMPEQRQSRREVERGTLEVSAEPNRGHHDTGFHETAKANCSWCGLAHDGGPENCAKAESIANEEKPANKPEERARPKSDKPAPETEVLETAVLDAQVGTTRLSAKQVEENKTRKDDDKHVGAPYYRISCIGDVLLYVYDQHIFRAVLAAKGKKKAAFVVQRGAKGLMQIKEVIHVDGVKFARDPATKDAIPADILAATEKVINAAAAPVSQPAATVAQPPSSQTAFTHGANVRSISAEVETFTDTDSVDGKPLTSSKTGKPFVIVTVKHLDADPKHDPHNKFYCHKPALFPSLRVAVGRKISFEFTSTTDAKGSVWQGIESVSSEDLTQDTGIFY